MPRAKKLDEVEVLEKAMFLFWKKGYYDTSIKDLIDFLGIQNGSLYNTFGGKKALFDQAFAHYRKINFEGLSNFLASQEDVRQGLTMVFQRIIGDDAADPDCKGCFIVNTSTELLPYDEVLKEAIATYREDMIQVFAAFLQKGVDAGQISPKKDIHTIANLLYTFMMGLRVVGKTKPDPEDSMKMIGVVLNLLG